MIDIKVQSASDWSDIQAQIEDHGAAFVEHTPDAELQPLTVLEVQFSCMGRVFAKSDGQVIQILPTGIAVAFSATARAELLAASYPEGPAPAAAKDDSESADKPLWARVGGMTKAEKIRLARHGNADARRILLKDRDRTLQLHLLNNPGLTAREVASLIRSGAVSHDFLHRVIQRSDLVGNPGVVEAIVRNPHTPIRTAVQLVPKLQKEVIRRIAKSGNLRGAVVSAARKLVLRR